MHISTSTTLSTILFLTTGLAFPTDSLSLTDPNSDSNNDTTLHPRAPGDHCRQDPWLATSSSGDKSCTYLSSHTSIKFGMGPSSSCIEISRAPNSNVKVFWGDCPFAVTQIVLYEGKKCEDDGAGGKGKMTLIKTGADKDRGFNCFDMSGYGKGLGSFRAVRKI